MATYRILTRVAPVNGTGCFFAVVMAVGDAGDEEPHDKCESGVFSAQSLASEAARRMADAMATRLTEAGHSVIAPG